MLSFLIIALIDQMRIVSVLLSESDDVSFSLHDQVVPIVDLVVDYDTEICQYEKTRDDHYELGL